MAEASRLQICRKEIFRRGFESHHHLEKYKLIEEKENEYYGKEN